MCVCVWIRFFFIMEEKWKYIGRTDCCFCILCVLMTHYWTFQFQLTDNCSLIYSLLLSRSSEDKISFIPKHKQTRTWRSISSCLPCSVTANNVSLHCHLRLPVLLEVDILCCLKCILRSQGCGSQAASDEIWRIIYCPKYWFMAIKSSDFTDVYISDDLLYFDSTVYKIVTWYCKCNWAKLFVQLLSLFYE